MLFVGIDAYVAAGGPTFRDLFTEAGEEWVEDIVLLDRLVGEKLTALAQDIRDREGWKWATAHLEYPYGHGCSRIFGARPATRTRRRSRPSTPCARKKRP
ncbi:hypothetical protein ACRAWD_05410 [Caulobacter segnis]